MRPEARARESGVGGAHSHLEGSRKPNSVGETDNEQEEKVKKQHNESKREGQGGLGPENVKDFHRQR